MGRAPCCDKANVKKGPWSPEEDAKLKHFIQTNGTGGNWITLPSKAGLRRCGKSCRLRWINYLRPDIKHGSFTEEEEKIIINFHHSVGSRWSLIAAQLPGRTDNDIKNYWNTRLKKKLADKGMNSLCHQQPQQRSHHDIRNSAGSPMFSLGRPSPQDATMMQQNPPSGTRGFMDRIMLSRQVPHQSSVLAQRAYYEQLRQQQQQQMLPVKEELAGDPAAVHSRMIQIESELTDLIAPPVCNNVLASTRGSSQGVDLLRQQSPNSPCSGWSSDRSHSDTFSSICNSYGDPPALVDAQSHHSLLPITNPLPNVRPTIQKEDSETGSSITSSGSYDGGLYGEALGVFPDQAQNLYHVVKEEASTDEFSTPRGLAGRSYPTRCGDMLPQLPPSLVDLSFPESFFQSYVI